ncbi:MAG: NADH-quinone oxidoreductase subunit H [Thermoplasmata archaeon]|nr:NADH-quinone oxidoreductase subunit H [Thermoplasmata archaeon]
MVIDLIIKIAILTGYAIAGTAIGLLFMGIGRKIVARVHNRVGPPFYQNFIDVAKLLSKKTNISHGWIFDLALLFSISGILLTLLFLPIGGVKLLSMDGDAFLVLYLLAIPSLGFALGAGASGNPNAGIGVMRALVMLLSYELPFVITLIALMIYYDTTSIAGIVESQHSQWAIFIPPFLLASAVADMALQGMLMEQPFDIPIAPHEIASGPMVEFGGKYLGSLMIYKAISIVVETTFFVDLFFGGGVIAHGKFSGIVNFISWLVLIFIFFTLALLINTAFPRFRIEQAFKFYWKYETILATISLIWVYWMVIT